MNEIRNHNRIYFAGHFAIDNVIRLQKEKKPTLGGSVSYCSLSLKTYVEDVNIKIISNIGRLNFDKALLDSLKSKDINLDGIKWSDSFNTTFVLDYYNHARSLTLKSRSPDLNFNDINHSIRETPDAIALVPLCNEISYDYVANITKYFPEAYIGIDLQGFLRKIDNHGKVLYTRNEEIVSNMDRIIKLIGDRLILKGSEIEMKMLSNKSDLNEVMLYFNDNYDKGIFIMTLGEMGSLVIKKGKNLLKIPAFKPKNVVDETGAGDVYLAIFLYEFVNSDKYWESIEKAAYLASAAASFLVEKNGTKGFESKLKVVERVNSQEYVNI